MRGTKNLQTALEQLQRGPGWRRGKVHSVTSFTRSSSHLLAPGSVAAARLWRRTRVDQLVCNLARTGLSGGFLLPGVHSVPSI